MIWNVKESGVFIMKTATAPHQTLRLEKWPNAKLINHQNFIKQKKKKKTKSNKNQHAKTLMLPAMPVAFLMKIVAAKQMVFLWWQTIKSLNVALLCQNNLTFHLQSWSQNRANYQPKTNIKKSPNWWFFYYAFGSSSVFLDASDVCFILYFSPNGTNSKLTCSGSSSSRILKR